MHFFPGLLVGFGVLTIIISIFLNSKVTPVLPPASHFPANLVCSSGNRPSNSPYFAGWNTWFHPERVSSSGQFREWNILHHLGGNGPWIQRTTPNSIENSLPDKCEVEQVHMLSRHSERYPTRNAGERHLALVRRLKDLEVPLNGSLSFFNNWTYFTQVPERDFDQLTSTGPYAGTLGAFTTGTRFRTRYGHLLPSQGIKTKIWASDSQRVIETAKYFAAGVFGIDWEQMQRAEVEVVPETLDQHTNTLTPGDTCVRYIEDTALGHDYGRNMLAVFQNAYIPLIAHRLVDEENNQAVGNLSALEVYGMQEMCGFESIVRGTSPWCELFTPKEWEHFEYARDLLHYYRGGPGNKYAAAMGLLWLHATGQLLQAGPENGTLFFSFVHDGDIAPMLTVLDLFPDPKYDPHLPVTHVAEDRVWRVSTVMPMGGRISFERLRCSGSDNVSNGTYVRINVNDDIVPLPGCSSGPGESCPLEKFTARISRKREELGGFAEVCKTSGLDTGITFLKQPGF
ncbi:histidine phosphatase superfamily [Talaromyces proteolyticus]|uniref:Histidine phosphatase superfamily n=1 Tax=Talaromyces proteolyticus TaxID=1131652 RepID=A0AAD4L2V2_9EURO|nr:histidine phosphatase superfamily [Talaromyces proteolyticus]KAH8705585.1 histidine phosphatase superfamily [Talaromyces proteolyticus]